MEQVRLFAVWPMEHLLGSSLNHIQGWTTVRESYSHALAQGPLAASGYSLLYKCLMPEFLFPFSDNAVSGMRRKLRLSFYLPLNVNPQTTEEEERQKDRACRRLESRGRGHFSCFLWVCRLAAVTQFSHDLICSLALPSPCLSPSSPPSRPSPSSFIPLSNAAKPKGRTAGWLIVHAIALHMRCPSPIPRNHCHRPPLSFSIRFLGQTQQCIRSVL